MRTSSPRLPKHLVRRTWTPKAYQKIFGCLGIFNVSCFMAFDDWSWLPCFFLQLGWAKSWQIYGHLRWITVSIRRAFSQECILPNVKHTDCVHHFENRTNHVFFPKNHVVFFQHEDYFLKPNQKYVVLLRSSFLIPNKKVSNTRLRSVRFPS